MNKAGQTVTRKIVIRLVLSSLAFVIALILSGVAFYYYHIRAPLVPLVVGLAGWPAAAIMLMSLYDLRSLKVKQSQQSHQPPQRS